MSEVFDPLDWSSTTATVSSLQRVATRIGIGLLRSVSRLPAAVGTEALALFSADNLWALAIVLACWVLGTVIGGPVGVAVDAILIAYALWDIPKVAEELGRALWDGLKTAASATKDTDIDLAAEQFATVFAAAGVQIFQVVLTHRLFVYAKPKLLKRFPKPKAIETEIKKGKKAQEEKQRASERKSKTEKLAEKAKSAAELTAAAGVRPAANSLPDVAALGAAAVVVVATGVGVLYLASETKK